MVHDYGDLCQAVTGISSEQQAAITTGEFRALHACLDDAVPELSPNTRG